MFHDECFTPWNLHEDKIIDADLFTIFEAAQYTHIRHVTIYKRISSGSLKAEKCRDGKWRVRKKDLDEWVDRRRSPSKAPSLSKKKADAPKSRIWRSEVIEPMERISAMEAANKIGVSHTWILQRRDQFGAVKISGVWYLSKKLVEDFVREEERREFESAS
jgi:excisionase family DNA binding protein